MPISEITQQKKQAAETSVQAAGLEATALSLGDILMGSVRDARAERGVSKLAEDRGTAMGQLASEPADIREFGTQEGFRMDPLDVDAFTGQARAQNLRTLGTVAQKGKEQEGTLQEVIQAGANQMYGMASMKEAEAKKDREEADALMEELIYEADRADQKFDEWYKREQLGDSRKGSEKSSVDLTDIQGSTPAPQYTPATGEGTVSDDGQWIYKEGKWSGNMTQSNLFQALAVAAAEKGDLSTAASILGKVDDLPEKRPTTSGEEGDISPDGNFIYYNGSWRNADEIGLVMDAKKLEGAGDTPKFE